MLLDYQFLIFWLLSGFIFTLWFFSQSNRRFVDRAIVGAFEGKIVVIRETEGFVDGVFDGNTDRILH